MAKQFSARHIGVQPFIQKRLGLRVSIGHAKYRLQRERFGDAHHHDGDDGRRNGWLQSALLSSFVRACVSSSRNSSMWPLISARVRFVTSCPGDEFQARRRFDVTFPRHDLQGFVAGQCILEARTGSLGAATHHGEINVIDRAEVVVHDLPLQIDLLCQSSGGQCRAAFFTDDLLRPRLSAVSGSRNSPRPCVVWTPSVHLCLSNACQALLWARI